LKVFPQPLTGGAKKEKRSKKERKGRPVETAAADGKSKSVAFGIFFLMISTSCLDKPER
jgi:hypothetical protein